jgi:hypothetical protein
LIKLRFGLARYFNQERGIDITSHAPFLSSNQAYKAAIAELKRVGKGGVEHYPEITKADFVKIYQGFDLSGTTTYKRKFYLTYFSIYVEEVGKI